MEVDSSDTVHAEIARLPQAGMFTEEEVGTTCCFATHDKVVTISAAADRV